MSPALPSLKSLFKRALIAKSSGGGKGSNKGFTVYCQKNLCLSFIRKFDFKRYLPNYGQNGCFEPPLKNLFDTLVLMLEKWRLNEEIVSRFQAKLLKILPLI